MGVDNHELCFVFVCAEFSSPKVMSHHLTCLFFPFSLPQSDEPSRIFWEIVQKERTFSSKLHRMKDFVFKKMQEHFPKKILVKKEMIWWPSNHQKQHFWRFILLHQKIIIEVIESNDCSWPLPLRDVRIFETGISAFKRCINRPCSHPSSKVTGLQPATKKVLLEDLL